MATMRLVGNDTIILDGRTFADFGSGEIGKISFSTDIATVKTGKNGNAVFASNESGNQATLELRLLRGSSDDKTLNTKLQSYKSDSVLFVLMTGSLVKRVGDGAGKVTNDTYILSGGVFTKNVEVVSNVEGDVEQALSVYTMQFAVAPRAIA